MTINLIVPSQLEADAVVPQCLDNQFVSEPVFKYMTTNNVGYSDETVHLMRTNQAKSEFIRSLIYSSQVIINRAYLINNPFVHNHFLPSNNVDLKASAALVRQRAMIPYLFEETSLVDDSAWDKHPVASQAIASLMDAVGQSITCVRLAIDDETNKKLIKILAQKFQNYLVSIKQYDEEQRNILAEELFGEKHALQDDEWKELNRRFDMIAEFAFDTKNLTRHKFYEQFINNPGTNTSLGLFRTNDPDASFLFEIKKLADLIYNTTLPDSLRRFTFTPTTLPSRAALQDQITIDEAGANWRNAVPTEDVLDYIRRHFMAQMQKPMLLPQLSKLTMADVLEVRQLEEWERFRQAQTAILLNPMGLHDLLPTLSQAFEQLQAALSSWYEGKYKAIETEDYYANFVTFVLQLGGRTICATAVAHAGLHHMVHVAGDTLVDEAVRFLVPKKATHIVAKLLMGVYDVRKRRLDEERSHTIELMRKNQLVLGDEIENVYRGLVDSKKDIQLALEHVADQGRQ